MHQAGRGEVMTMGRTVQNMQRNVLTALEIADFSPRIGTGIDDAVDDKYWYGDRSRRRMDDARRQGITGQTGWRAASIRFVGGHQRHRHIGSVE